MKNKDKSSDIHDSEPKSFAIIETGGKQYMVSPGKTIKIEKIAEPEKGEFLYFDKVLLYSDGNGAKIGKPYLSEIKVKAEWEKEARAKKISILRYHSKTRHRRKKGHRQIYTQIKIKEIEAE